MFGNFPTTRARSRSYDVASAPRPAALHLPPSSPYYPPLSPRRRFDSHSLATLPPLTPPYGSIPLTPREPAAIPLSARERALDRYYGVSAGDLYPSAASPLTKHSGGTFFPQTQPLPHRGPSDSSFASGQTGFSLSQMMSGLSVDDGRAKHVAQNPKKFYAVALDGVDGRSRSASSPIVPQSVLSRNAVSGTISARPQALLSGATARE